MGRSGFEPPTHGFQSVDEKSQPQQKQTLITTPEQRLQTSLQKNPENGQKSADSLPVDLAEIVAAWPELPVQLVCDECDRRDTEEMEREAEFYEGFLVDEEPVYKKLKGRKV